MIRRTLTPMCASRGKRRPRRGEIPDATAIRQAVRNLQAFADERPVRRTRRRPPICSRIDPSTASPRCRNSRVRALMDKKTTRLTLRTMVRARFAFMERQDTV